MVARLVCYGKLALALFYLLSGRRGVFGLSWRGGKGRKEEKGRPGGFVGFVLREGFEAFGSDCRGDGGR